MANARNFGNDRVRPSGAPAEAETPPHHGPPAPVMGGPSITQAVPGDPLFVPPREPVVYEAPPTRVGTVSSSTWISGVPNWLTAGIGAAVLYTGYKMTR